MIKLQVIGHLGQSATVNVSNGKNVINFSVAHSEKYKNAQGVDMQRTTWVSCSYWTDKVAVAQYLKKGTQVYVEGQPDVRMYEDRNRQQQANITLRVFSIQLLGSKERSDSDAKKDIPTDADQVTEPFDDLPF